MPVININSDMKFTVIVSTPDTCNERVAKFAKLSDAMTFVESKRYTFNPAAYCEPEHRVSDFGKVTSFYFVKSFRGVAPEEWLTIDLVHADLA